MRRILKWKGKEFCPNKETFTTSLKRKLIMLLKENAQLRQDYLRRRQNRTEENGKESTLILLFMKTSRQLESQRMELYLANQSTDQAQREKSWLFEELGMRNRAWRTN